jgi:selenide,water dikinase
VGPGDLRVIMAGLAQPPDAAVLVGTETSDDAGVYRLSDTQAIVTTADFITPPTDDPFLFGQIAAANALSDVYAMGGRPLTAVALCMFPKELSLDVARQILAGGQARVNEAGAQVVGGHTVRGDELLYGLSVTGVVAPARILRNVGARPGDALLLTKPLGSGLIINGMRKEAISEAEARPTLERVAELNRVASAIAVESWPEVHAMTDVTGFGLVGHALGMTRLGQVSLHIDLPSLPLYPRVREMVVAGVTTGSTKPNRAYAAAELRTAAPLPRFWDELVHDPQTSGGLLMAVAAEAADALVARLHAAGVSSAARIGEVRAAEQPFIELRGE